MKSKESTRFSWWTNRNEKTKERQYVQKHRTSLLGTTERQFTETIPESFIGARGETVHTGGTGSINRDRLTPAPILKFRKHNHAWHNLWTLSLPQDGVLGPQTRKAILSFQAQQQLPQTGMLDANTASALQSQCGGQGNSPVPASAGAKLVATSAPRHGNHQFDSTHELQEVPC